jgi:phosphoserine phosphatase
MTDPFTIPGAKPETLLITLSGKDRPGVTSSVFAALSGAGVEVLDIEQIVLRRRLILGVLVTAPRNVKKVRAAIEETAAALGMSVDIDRGVGDNKSRREGRSHVTIIGTPLRASAMAAVAGRIADSGANIDRIERMARYPVTAIDLHVSGVDTGVLRTVLAAEAAAQGVDIAVQPANLLRRGTRLIVMDVDSTLIQGEVIEMLAAHAGFEAEVAAITGAAMRGELDFEESLRARVALLAGVPATALDEVYDAIQLQPGARTLVRTLRRLGYRFALVSGGFSQITDRLAEDLGIHFSRANELEIVDGVLTGQIVGAVVDRAGKASALREFAAEIGLTDEAVIAIGDGANDLDMLNAAGLGIAYNAKPLVRDAADTSVNVPYLDAIMYLLGISREEIEAADAEAGIVTPSPPV